jgi:hypothetical protein
VDLEASEVLAAVVSMVETPISVEEVLTPAKFSKYFSPKVEEEEVVDSPLEEAQEDLEEVKAQEKAHSMYFSKDRFSFYIL